MLPISQAFYNSYNSCIEEVAPSELQSGYEPLVGSLALKQAAKVYNTSFDLTIVSQEGKGHRGEFIYNNNLIQQFNDRRVPEPVFRGMPMPYNRNHRRKNVSLSFSDTMTFYPTPQSKYAPDSLPQVFGPFDFNDSSSYPIYSPDIETPVWCNQSDSESLSPPSPTTPLFANPEHGSPNLVQHLQNESSYCSEEDVLDSTSITESPPKVKVPVPESPIQQSFPVILPNIQQPDDNFSKIQSQLPQTPQPATKYTSRSMRKHRHTVNRTDLFLSSKSGSSTNAFSVEKSKKPRSRQNSLRTATEGRGINFINFTPSDSKEILSGVAPSGSYKTMTRRESEAARKMRSLAWETVKSIREGNLKNLAMLNPVA